MSELTVDAVMRTAPVIAVLTIEREGDAVPLARALVEGGLKVLEITLRTQAALPSIAAIARDVPEALVGVGTVTSGGDLDRAGAAGACFAVSPGLTDRLAAEAKGAAVPLLPGVATAGELMRAVEYGYDRLKFFPAEASGGVAALKGFAAPFPSVKFCPTGGVTPDNVRSYLDCPNVLCVGGSWVAPKAAISAGDWAAITELARAAASLSA